MSTGALKITLGGYGGLVFVWVLVVSCAAAEVANVPEPAVDRVASTPEALAVAPLAGAERSDEVELVCSWAGGVPADVDPDDVAKVVHLLSRHEYTVDASALYRATPDPPAALLAVAIDLAKPASLRLRAFDTMAFVADERVRAAYTRAIDDRGCGTYRHHAIVGLARAWPDDAMGKIGPLLAIEDDPQIRVTAGSALVTFCGSRGLALVHEAASVEPEEWVRDKLIELAGEPPEGSHDETQ